MITSSARPSLRSLKLLAWLALLWPLRKLFRAHQSAWMIGENRGFPTGDNGYWFFRYCREQHPDQQVWFIADHRSPWYGRLVKEGLPVVRYGSLFHAWQYLGASLGFYTHLPSDLVCRRCIDLFGFEGRLIYLHHGVLGFKTLDQLYLSQLQDLDLFVVGAPFEQEILIQEERVPEEKVVLAGYPRLDYGIKETPIRRQILYMPTHRASSDGTDKHILLHEQIRQLLQSPRLHALLQSLDATFVFRPHAYFDLPAAEVSSSSRIRIAPTADSELSEILAESALLITDYSSVAWDFLQQGKPVIFYRFDLEEYGATRRSYLDLQDQSLGPVLCDQSALLDCIEQYAKQDFRQTEGFILADKYRLYRPPEGAGTRIFHIAQQMEKECTN